MAPDQPPAASLSSSLIAAAKALRADVVAAEAAAALAEAGMSAVLLRGPSIARHVYPPTEVRPYGDADLLVRSESKAAAESVLGRLGFVDATGLGRRPDDRPVWSTTWVRASDGGNVDLHVTIVGAEAEPNVVWEVLSNRIDPLEVASARLDGLDATATALIVALHAAQHGVAFSRPLRDLEFALQRLPVATWLEAGELAGEIDAVEAFSAGLRLVPTGAVLAEELKLPADLSTEALLRAATPPPMALGFAWMARTPGVRRKLRFVVGKAVPDRAFMRVWFAPARGGSALWLAVGYVWRPLWLVTHSVAGLSAWLKARRRSYEGSS